MKALFLLMVPMLVSASVQASEVFRLSSDLSVVTCWDAEIEPIPMPTSRPTSGPSFGLGRNGQACSSELLMPRTREIVLSELPGTGGQLSGAIEFDRQVDGSLFHAFVHVAKIPSSSEQGGAYYYLRGELSVNGAVTAAVSFPASSDVALHGLTLSGAVFTQGRKTYTPLLYLSPPLQIEPIPTPTATATSVPPSPVPVPFPIPTGTPTPGPTPTPYPSRSVVE